MTLFALIFMCFETWLKCEHEGAATGRVTFVCVCVAVVSVESREAHLSSLVLEAEQRAADLAAQAQKDGLSLEACHKDKQLRAWEWRSKLYKRMKTGFQHARESPLIICVFWFVSHEA